MASVNFLKLHTPGEVKAMIRHCDRTERMTRDHANRDIDPARVGQNVQTKLSYGQVCERYDRRIADIDAAGNSNRRKDRVTCFGLTIPAAAGMSAEQSKAFFRAVTALCGNRFGTQNIVGAYMHFDEIHDYFDPAKGAVVASRPHLHIYVIPEINGKLNGKKFSTKGSMQALNREIDNICREKFGVKFLTGEQPRHQVVEDLKRISNNAAVLTAAERAQEQQREDIDREMATYAAVAQERAKSIEKEVVERREVVAEYNREISDLHRQIDRLERVRQQYSRDDLGAAIKVAAQEIEIERLQGILSRVPPAARRVAERGKVSERDNRER